MKMLDLSVWHQQPHLVIVALGALFRALDFVLENWSVIEMNPLKYTVD